MQGLALASKRRRTPSGQYSRAGEREAAPTRIKRARDAALANMGDPRWGSELGRLHLQGTITDAMYAAGVRWAELAAKYQSAIGIFPSRSASMERGALGSPPDPDSDEGRKVAKRETDNAERFFEAHAVLVNCGMLTEQVVRRACEHDEAVVGLGDLGKLRTGLMALASLWGIDYARNRV